jgi:hypothetical protein
MSSKIPPLSTCANHIRRFASSPRNFSTYAIAPTPCSMMALRWTSSAGMLTSTKGLYLLRPELEGLIHILKIAS